MHPCWPSARSDAGAGFLCGELLSVLCSSPSIPGLVIHRQRNTYTPRPSASGHRSPTSTVQSTQRASTRIFLTSRLLDDYSLLGNLCSDHLPTPLATALGINISAYIFNMPSTSHLRIQTHFEPISAETTRTPFVSSPPAKKQRMSLTQTYYIAASARSKLGKEACRADHDLRLLVGHANLLDSLMIELQDAERQQEAWFHSTVAKAQKSEEPRHIQWADSIPEDDDDDSSDSDSESDYYDEEGDFDMVMPRRIAQAPVQISTIEVDDEDDQYDDLEDDEGLALTRVPSQSPPELVHDEDSDDESPPTPPQPTMEFSAKEAMLTTSFYDEKSQPLFQSEEIYLPESTAPLITSY
ncbi:hypothetical protein DPSP01_009453 [Paraphaeosphaeria sporulosa]